MTVAPPKKNPSGASEKVPRRSPRQVLDDIISAAHSEFKEHGYERTTTAAIGRKAQVSESQIYRYFATKLDLFHESIFHYIERDLTEFYRNGPEPLDAPDLYVGTDNEIGAQRISALQKFLRRNSEAIMTLLFARNYVPDAKGLGEIAAVEDFFKRSEEDFVSYRTSKDGKTNSLNPNLMLRALFLSLLANSVFRDTIFPPGIASEKEIDDAVTASILEGLGAFAVRKG